MGNNPSDLPPPPPPPASASPTRIAGQEHAPTSTVPMAPPGSLDTPSAGQTNTLAIISLGSGVVSVFGHLVLPGIGGGTLAFIAIVTGFMARGQVKQTGESGMWMANVGIIIGIVHFALLILLFFLVIVAIFFLGWSLFGFHH